MGVTTRGSIATTPGAFDTEGSFGIDVGLIKLNPAGSALDYATYVAGQDQDNLGSVAVDRDRNAVITGNTYSTDFPTTPGAFQTTFPSSYGSLTSESAFVTKVNAAGSDLVYSTYLGARPRGTLGQGVAVDASGSAYVTGMTRASTFPTTPGAYDRTFNNNGLRPDRRVRDEVRAVRVALVLDVPGHDGLRRNGHRSRPRRERRGGRDGGRPSVPDHARRVRHHGRQHRSVRGQAQHHGLGAVLLHLPGR